jgi:uncharacterized membrane protein
MDTESLGTHTPVGLIGQLVGSRTPQPREDNHVPVPRGSVGERTSDGTIPCGNEDPPSASLQRDDENTSVTLITSEAREAAAHVSPSPFGGDASALKRRDFRKIRKLGFGLMVLQLSAMLVFSTHQYDRFALTKDFAGYSQAWWAIAHGNLSPYSTVFGTAFWRNNADFAMWPLSLLYHVYPHPIDLLWFQDFVVFATNVVCLDWIVKVLERSVPEHSQRSTTIAVGSILVLVLNPWVYETMAFDFHFETLATLFAILVARDLWEGRFRRLWWWVMLALISEALGGLYLIGVALSGVLAGRRTQRQAAWIGAVGLAWLFLMTAIGGDGLGNHGLNAWYGYLIGTHKGSIGILDIVFGVLRHPGLVAHMVASRWLVVFEFVVVFGLIGLISPWGAGMAFVVFIPSVLNSSPYILRLTAAFQSWPALPFVLVGSVMVAVRLAAGDSRRLRVATAAAVAWGSIAAAVTAVALPAIPSYWISVQASAAATLAKEQQALPPNAEVVVSNGVVRRFGERSYVYIWGYEPQNGETADVLPIHSRLIVFILTPDQGIHYLRGDTGSAALTFLERRLGGHLTDEHNGIYVVDWTPPPGVSRVTLQ